jgi:hypothetical protein
MDLVQDGDKEEAFFVHGNERSRSTQSCGTSSTIQE